MNNPTEMNMSQTPVLLGNALGLRPLDRVQINNAHEIKEIRVFSRRGENFDLPFFYFQRVLNDGCFEVRSPGGYVTSVDPLDICDFVPGEPIVVRAMPESVFKSRLSLSLKDRQKAPPIESYAEAFVLFAQKDKWGRAEAMVWFKNADLNTQGRPWRAPIYEEDYQSFCKKARRANMPVIKYGSSANYSADQNLWQAQFYAKTVVANLIAASLNGDQKVIECLAAVGAKKISMATMNNWKL